MNEIIQNILNKYTPCGMNLLVLPAPVKEKSSGGIIIPEQAQSRLSQGEVLKIGNNVASEDFAVGQTVMWPQHTESKITVDGVVLMLISADTVLLKSV